MDLNKHRKPWWSKKYGRDKICGITMSRLRPGKNKYGYSYTLTLDCNHSFYRSALINWVIHTNIPTCPICRQSFETSICFLK